MRKPRIFIGFSAIGLSMVIGCYPASWTVTPRISGRVETPDHQPVGNATVTVEKIAGNLGEPGGRFFMTTNASGSFFHAEQTRWVIVPLVPIDALVPLYSVTAGADGQQTKAVTFGGDDMTGPNPFGLGSAHRSYDLGPLVLQKPASTASQPTPN